MNHVLRLFAPLLLIALPLLQGCSDEISEVNGMSIECDLTKIESGARYHTLRLKGLPSEGVSVHSDSEWIVPESESVGADGIVELWAEANTEYKGRTVTLIFTTHGAHPKEATFKIYQKGVGENDDNAADDPFSDFKIGWGMNAYDEYQSATSIRGQVIDSRKLIAFDSEDGFQSVQEVIRSQADFYCVSSTSEREMSAVLTEKQDKSSSFMGVKKTMKRFSQITQNSASQQFCCYSRMSKVVASRSIDAGAIRYIIDTYAADKIPFTDDFRKVYQQIISSSDAAKTQTLIADMLDKYGTHVVIEGNVGGMIDYVGSFDRRYASSSELVSTEQSKRVFGKSSSSASTELRKSLISDISNSASIQVKGGDPALRKLLLDGIHKLNKLDVVPNDLLEKWYASIRYSPGNYSSLDLIDFKVFPIWDLFVDKSMSQQVMEEVLRMQSQSNYVIPDQELGTDNYEFSASDPAFNFTDTASAESSLVKICYVNKVPVMEICEEYVPKIRSDKRIKVFYPIYMGKTIHAQGLFPGDGEGNRPAQLAFYEGDCYVTPLEEYGPHDKLVSLFYIHGNLYESNFGNASAKPRDVIVADHRLQFSEWQESYPVVKIGSGYWTRSYIRGKMNFGVFGGRRPKVSEIVEDNILFANIYHTNNNAFLSANSEVYGPVTESYYNKQTLWYLPTTADLRHLTQYLGKNAKSLFKGQVTGFDAQFEGYFGSYDDSGSPLGSTQRRRKGERCYIAFKDGATTSTGEALVLSPNYTWNRIVTSSDFNWYPVRLFRTNYYIHKNL